MKDGYRLVPIAPSVSEYVRLRRESGLTPRSTEQARLAIEGGWAACHLVHEATAQAVAMGRLIGDGGWSFQVVDLAVLPAHQRRGLGGQVLSWLLDQIRERAPSGAFVSLMADPPGRALYSRHGFTEDPAGSIGMARWL